MYIKGYNSHLAVIDVQEGRLPVYGQYQWVDEERYTQDVVAVWRIKPKASWQRIYFGVVTGRKSVEFRTNG